MKANKLALSAAACALWVLILDSRTASRAAVSGIDVCIRTVIPSLFPFSLLSGYLTGNLQCGAWFASLFGCPKNCGSLLLTGFLGGYPMGASLTAQQFHSGNLSKEEADRLIMFCSQAGPSFLFGITAVQLESTHLGWFLWLIILLSSLSVAWLIPGNPHNFVKPNDPPKRTLTEAMTASIRAMSAVCGWVVIFNILMTFLRKCFLWILPLEIQVLFSGLLELTNGCLTLGSVENIRIRFLLAVIMLNFGSICVWMQTASVAQGLSLRRYFLGKLLQTGFAVLYTLILMGYLWFLPFAFLIFFGRKLIKTRNSSSIPLKLGV